MQRLAWIGVVAWILFTATDFADASLSHGREILTPLLAIRGVAVAVALTISARLRRPGVSSGTLMTCDVLYFAAGSVHMALRGALLGAFNFPDLLGMMILCFARAALLPSRWTRALTIPLVGVLAFLATLVVAASIDPVVRAGWFAPGPAALLAYSLAEILAGIAIGSVASHMAWAARQEVREARRLGSYRLKARIGSGANGDVWLARQDPLGRDVALKVMKTRGQGDEDARRRFAREAKAASLLRHPNTIRIFEYGASDDGVFFFAMELLDGLDLEMLVARSGRLAPARAIHVALQACGSLAEAHAAGIVHRDIKPANLFVTRVGEDRDFLKVLDFGVAKMIESDRAAKMTQAGDLMGTPAYMAPEACNGDPADALSDVYSLGAALYFMVTGTELFPDRSMTETILAQMAQEPELPSKRLQACGLSIAADLDTLIMRCLKKDRRERYPSMHALEDALRGLRDCTDVASVRRLSASIVPKSA